MTWRVEPDANSHAVRLHHETDGVRHYTTVLDASEAWDLGDDLIIVAIDLLSEDPIGFTTLPPWVDKIQVAIAMSNRLAIICEDHGAIQYPGMRIPLAEVQDLAREHWKQQHSEVAQDAEGEHGDGHAVPAVHDAVAVAEPIAQAEDRGDEVQDDGEHV